MAKSSSAAASGSTVALTPRQRRWLEHLKRCEGSGETMKAYAKRHRLSIQAMYQAAKDLRRRGVLAPGRRTPRDETGASFVRIAASVSGSIEPPWRVRFPGGAVLEGTRPLTEESLRAVVTVLAASR